MKGFISIKLNISRDVLVFVACGALTFVADAQPELKITPQQGSAYPGRAYRIVCEVSWTGAAWEYSILPAALDPIDWGTATLTDVKAFVRSDADGARNIVSQTLEITPNKAGEFKTPAIRILYFNPEATPPAESAASNAVTPGTAPPDSSASPSLGAEPFNLMVYPDRSPIWFSGGLGASLLLLTALGWWSVRRLRRPQPLLAGFRVSGIGSRGAEEEKPGTAEPRFDEVLGRARRYRQEGDFYRFYVELSRAAEMLPANGRTSELTAAFKARAQEAGYKGVRPTDDQMDGDLRDFERAIRGSRVSGFGYGKDGD